MKITKGEEEKERLREDKEKYIYTASSINIVATKTTVRIYSPRTLSVS